MQGAWADGETIEEAVNNIQDVIKSILEYKKEREESKKKLCLI